MLTPTASPTPDRLVIKAGGVYSVLNGDKAFAVVRVLVVEAGAVHVRFYSNEYKERPGHVDPRSLKVDIGHVPLEEQQFRNWQPVLLYEEPVKESELEGYRLWKNR